jgi:hypothetical protein
MGSLRNILLVQNSNDDVFRIGEGRKNKEF